MVLPTDNTKAARMIQSSGPKFLTMLNRVHSLSERETAATAVEAMLTAMHSKPLDSLLRWSLVPPTALADISMATMIRQDRQCLSFDVEVRVGSRDARVGTKWDYLAPIELVNDWCSQPGVVSPSAMRTREFDACCRGRETSKGSA